MKPVRSIVLLALSLLASCGTGSDKNKSASTPPARQSLNERFGGGGGRDPNSFQQDSNGKLKIDNAKRSPFERQSESHLSNKSFAKQEYKAGDYAKKSWWGNKQYDKQSYSGNTDGSQFQKSSALGGKGASEAGNQARIPDKYRTGNYATGDARESTSTQVREAGSTARERARAYDQFQWDEERSLTVDQSKSLLGH